MPKPLLENTGQRAQLIFAGVLLFAGFGIASLTPVWMSRGYDAAGAIAFGAGALFMAGAASQASRATTCPKCKLRWLQYALRHRPANQWLRWLLTLERCPRCSYSGQDAEH